MAAERLHPPPVALGEEQGVLAMYKALCPARVKTHPSLGSERVAKLTTGQVVRVFERRTAANGDVRLRCRAGWVQPLPATGGGVISLRAAKLYRAPS